MTPKFLLLLFTLLINFSVFAQTVPVTGKVVDGKDNSILPGATVQIIRLPDSVRTAALVTDGNGVFKVEQKAGKYLLKASFLGFETLQKSITVANKPLDLGNVGLQVNAKMLKEVEIVEKVPMATQKGDTTEFSAKAFKVNPDANSDALVEKMPGVVIEDGKVKARGQDVKKVRVDGKEFFGDDAMATLKNLPADIVDKLQIIEEQSESSRQSGVDDGVRNMTMNIVTRPDRRNGIFGRVLGGAGTDERYQVGGAVNIFKPNRRISVLGQSNSVNEQNFSIDDFLGGGTSGGRRSGSGGFGGNGNMITHSAGLNYSQQWGKNLELSGSYFGNYTNNTGFENSFRQYNNPEQYKQDIQEEQEIYARNNTNHRMNGRLEYKIDSSNTLFVQPRLSFQMNNGFSNSDRQIYYLGEPRTLEINENSNDLIGYNIGNDLVFRHRFAKRGRSASVSFNIGVNQNNSENYIDSRATKFLNGNPSFDIRDQLRDQEADGINVNTNISYTEPLTKTSNISVNYSYGFNKNDSDRRTYDYEEQFADYTNFNEQQSNTFLNNSTSQQAGLGYNYYNAKINFNSRVSYQYSELNNERVYPKPGTMGRGFVRIIPNANLQYRFSRQKNLRLSYNGNTGNPSLDQLQDVEERGTLTVRVGNPNLKQTYRHEFDLRYFVTKPENSSTFVASISGSLGQNQIANNRYVNNTGGTIEVKGVTLPALVQLIRPENVDGQIGVRSYISYGLPVKPIKSNVNVDIFSNYNRNPGISQDIRNFSYSQSHNLGLSISSNISERLDFSISSRSGYNVSSNTLTPDTSITYFNQSTRFRLNWIFYKGFVFNTSFNHRINTGLASGFNQSRNLLTLAVGKKVFKKQNGDIRLSVYDALNQNNSFNRNINTDYFEDVETQVLQRYYMLTFTYNIRKFGNGSGNPGGDRGGDRGRGDWDRNRGGDRDGGSRGSYNRQ